MELAGNRGRDAVVSGTIEALTAHQALRVAAARTNVLLRTAQDPPTPQCLTWAGLWARLLHIWLPNSSTTQRSSMASGTLPPLWPSQQIGRLPRTEALWPTLRSWRSSPNETYPASPT